VPAKSKKQERFMQAVANNPKFAKKVGVPQSVGKEFTKVKKYNPGGKVITPKKEKARIKEIAREDRYKKIRERDMKLFGPNEESKPAKDVDISTRKGFKELINKPVKKRAGGMLKTPDNPGLKKLPTEVRNKMGYMKKGGKVKQMKKGGMVKRGDGCAVRGKTKGRMV
jgi:hypothetical protein